MYEFSVLKVLIYFFLILFGIAAASKNDGPTNIKNSNAITHYMDLLARDLKSLNWAKDETQCLEQTLTILLNEKNFTLWASWILDSMQPPVGVLYGSRHHLGNFDECLHPPWIYSHPQLTTQYCLAKVYLTDNRAKRDSIDAYGSTETYIKTSSKYGIHFNDFTWSTCVPKACGPASIPKFLQTVLRHSHLGSMGATNISVESCQVAGDHQYSFGFYAFIAVIATLSGTALISTYYVNNISYTNSNYIATVLAKSFNIVVNASDLVKSNKDDIKVMHGIRFLSAVLIVVIHQPFYISIIGSGNEVQHEKNLDTPFFIFFLHSNLAVDTFFAMSGLLFAKGFLPKKMNPFKVLLKRYLRLMGPLAVVLFTLSTVFIHTGTGPIWPMFAGAEQKRCQQNWWLNMLMLNNYINSIDFCHGPAWYVTVDYHFTIIGTALIYLWQRNARAGAITFMAMAILAIIVPGIITYWNQYPAIAIFDIKTLRGFYSLVGLPLREVYLRSHMRAGAYLVGLAMGYFMIIYKPADYRKALTRKQSILGCTLSLSVMLFLMYFGGLYFSRQYQFLEGVAFAALNRVVWAIAICFLIACCEYGTVPIINEFLSWPAFVPLSRISYGLYLIHPIIVQRNLYASRSPIHLHFFATAVDAFGVLVVSCIISLLTWLLVEAPLIKLSNRLLDVSNLKEKPS